MDPARRTVWDFWASRYDRLWVQKHSLGPTRAMVHARIGEAAPGATRFLDVGCGIGQFALEVALRRPGAEVVAVDPSRAMIDRARRDFAHPRVSHLHGFVEDVPRGDGFDVVTCQHALPYVPDAAAAVARMRDLLRPGGRVLIVHANAESAWDRFCLALVELTTTPARYRSAAAVRALIEAAGLKPGVVRRLPAPRWFVSIHLVEGVL